MRAGAQAVKLEGGRRRIPAVRAILDAEIPVMGHLGLTPQSVHVLGGFVVQGKDAEAAGELELDAEALVRAGCFALVLEGVPDLVASRVTATIPVPTIGIGAGPDCDGQVLVLHDLLGLSTGRPPKFVRRYADLATASREAIASVRRGRPVGRLPVGRRDVPRLGRSAAQARGRSRGLSGAGLAGR